MEAEVIRAARKGKLILLFSLYFELFRRIDVFPIQTLIITAITQCHVDGNQRAWATCGKITDNRDVLLCFAVLVLKT